MKKVLAFWLVIIMTILNFSFTNEIYAAPINNDEQEQDRNIVSLYCWDLYDFNLSKLKEEIEYLGINTLYIQRYSYIDRIDRLKQVMEFAKLYNLDVFLLDGDQDWLTTEGNIKYVYDVIEQAYELNKVLDYKIKGVSLDVEFYNLTSNKEERKALFRTYTERTKECCNYAKSLGLEYSMALPAWFDEQDMENELEELMRGAEYDHILFMNYSVKNATTKLTKEVEIAKKYGTKIVSAAEVDWVDEVGVSFYDAGIQACIDSLNLVKETYNYENLGISYHHYRPLIELLERIHQGIENKYELEVHPYIEDEENRTSVEIEVDEVEITANDSTIITDETTFKPAVKGYYSEKGEYVINFFGLEYGKEYTLTVKSHSPRGTLMGTKTFTYEKGDITKKDYEIAITDMKLEISEENNSDTENPGEENQDEEKTGKDNTVAKKTLPYTGLISNDSIIVLALAILFIINLITIIKSVMNSKRIK